MAYATIMVNYGFESGPDPRLHLAKSLADRFNATLIGVASRGITPVVVEGIMVSAQLTAAEHEELQELLANQQTKFVNSTQGCAKPTEWRSGVEPPTAFLARESRAADIILIEQHGGTGNLYESLDPAGLILSAGRPVLMIPSKVSELSAKNVIIGWKDTRESRRAVQDSLPFLHEAESVFESVFARTRMTTKHPAGSMTSAAILAVIGSKRIRASFRRRRAILRRN